MEKSGHVPSRTSCRNWSGSLKHERLVVLLFCLDGILVYRLETLFRFCQFFSLSSGQVLVILTDRWFLISEIRNALWSSVVKLKPKKLTRPIKTKVFMARSQSELDVADVKRGKRGSRLAMVFSFVSDWFWRPRMVFRPIMSMLNWNLLKLPN